MSLLLSHFYLFHNEAWNMHNESCLNNIFTLMLYYVYEYALSSNTSSSLSPFSCTQLTGAFGKVWICEKMKSRKRKGKKGNSVTICCDSCRYTRVAGLENAVHHFVVFKRNLPASGPALPSCSHLSAQVPPLMSLLRSFKCCSLLRGFHDSSKHL